MSKMHYFSTVTKFQKSTNAGSIAPTFDIGDIEKFLRKCSIVIFYS